MKLEIAKMSCESKNGKCLCEKCKGGKGGKGKKVPLMNKVLGCKI